MHADKSRKPISEENTGGQVTQAALSSGVGRASEAAIHYFSTNPYFQVALELGHMEHSRQHVPLAFAKRYFEGKAQTMTLWVGKRSWPVKLLAYPSAYKFSAGWGAFARENSLRPRDVCIFELTQRNQLDLKVTIFRQAG
ncbi:B3 DNA binding domain containing protein [Trema orientale]|uniref:B3 DNA binding domain containing protein n=1 Tax=Trema orientale TaxID=63057 RepID=A0A2P5FXZ2_TREOI|nr:B3 DNA binding domain containing protein [Trema orientale]